jgi:hypothetical protein
MSSGCALFPVCREFSEIWNELRFTEGYPVIIFDEANRLYAWSEDFPRTLEASVCRKGKSAYQ